MSRCFPFPPPGYEKKARTEDPDFLKQEKQREKKHKQEKKDKEKGESKEKKDKDRSDEKHREKKDKKEKRKEKKKEKDKDKDRDKSSNSDEKRFSGQSEVYDGEKTSNDKVFPWKAEVHNMDKFSQKEKDKDRSNYTGEKNASGQFSGYGAEKHGRNNYLARDTKGSKFLPGVGRRVGDDDRPTGSQLVEKFAGADPKRDEGMLKLVAEATSSMVEWKEKKDKRGDDRNIHEQGVGDEARVCGNVMVQNLSGMVQTSGEGMLRSMEKDVEGMIEGKEKTKQKERDDKRGDKHKGREKNNQRKDKEKKKEEKVKMKSEHKNIAKDKLKDINKDDLIGTNKTLHLPKDSDKNAVTEGNLWKRKEFESNGFYHAKKIKPNKLSRPTSSSHPLVETNKWPRPTSSLHPVVENHKFCKPTSSSHSLTENGRVLVSCQASSPVTSDGQGATGNRKADSKECKVNGIILSQPLSVSTAKPVSTTAQADQIAEASKKPPHPDTKYLSQILSIPKMEEWSDFDDQEWLFHSSNSQLKMPKAGSFTDDEMAHVWAEAMRIESADVCALPYVIPY